MVTNDVASSDSPERVMKRSVGQFLRVGLWTSETHTKCAAPYASGPPKGRAVRYECGLASVLLREAPR